MKERAIIATTHIDKSYDRLTKEALEGMVIQINESNSSIPIYIEHDNTIPPLGKTVKAEIEQREDKEYQVVVTQEYFDNIEWLDFNGVKLFKQQSKEDNRPFIVRSSDEDYSIHLDLNNFAPKNDYQKFITEIRDETEIEINYKIFGRKSYIPDPEIVINLIDLGARLFGTYLLVKKTKIGEKIDEIAADEIEKFYKFIRTIVIKGAKYLKPENRPKTYIFVISKNPDIEFIARASDSDKIISAVKKEIIEGAINEVIELNDTFNASKIQYLLTETGDWKFNYLLTKNGEVIGTEKSLQRRAKRIELLESQNRIKQAVENSVAELISKRKKLPNKK